MKEKLKPRSSDIAKEKSVRLDQDLLTLMEDEERWAIRNKLVDAKKIPDYSVFLDLEGLRKIKPEAVGAN